MTYLQDRFRMLPALLISLGLGLICWAINADLFGTMMAKGAMTAAAAYFAYWIDRKFYPDDRGGCVQPNHRPEMWRRRARIFLACAVIMAFA